MLTGNCFCHILFMKCDTAFDQDEAILALPFGESEKERLRKIKDPSSKRNSLCSLLCLQSLLHSYGIDPSSSDLTVIRKENGKPYFSSLELHFSISHSKDICAVALSDSNVGIDIELADNDRDVLAISKRFFDPEEYFKISQSKLPNEEFLLLWTQKEALAKLSGLGLSSICSRKLPQSSAYNFKSYRLELDGRNAYLSVCSDVELTNIEYDKHKEISLYEIQN